MKIASDVAREAAYDQNSQRVAVEDFNLLATHPPVLAFRSVKSMSPTFPIHFDVSESGVESGERDIDQMHQAKAARGKRGGVE